MIEFVLQDPESRGILVADLAMSVRAPLAVHLPLWRLSRRLSPAFSCSNSASTSSGSSIACFFSFDRRV